MVERSFAWIVPGQRRAASACAAALDLRVSSLVELLRSRADSQAEEVAFRFLPDGEAEKESMTYGELDRRARAVAAWLQERSLAGERALLLDNTGPEYVVGFFGCLYAGVTAIPAYPPRRNRKMDRLHTIAADAGAAAALTSRATFERMRNVVAETPELDRVQFMQVDELPAGLESGWRDPGVTPETLAFLQYTSGSTSNPRGVRVTHGNLLHNLSLIDRGFQHPPNSCAVFWLPLYHDMGLIGGVLEMLYIGKPSVLMPPVAFLSSPFRWLSAITRYRATTAGAPNFAYELCIRKITPEQKAQLDLSSWVLAFTGAEPIRADTLDRFVETFAPHGFRRQAFYPCYGLAEATLIVSGGLRDEPPILTTVRKADLERNRVKQDREAAHPSLTLVSSGGLLQDVVIVDPETLVPCPPDRVGEVWVGGPSVADGYWNCPEETERTFGARLADGRGPWLRTGDLGFLAEGELYITGRLKDLIILWGRNHYPQDLEQTVEASHPSVRSPGAVAFGLEVKGEERLVVAAEVERHLSAAGQAEVIAAIRQAVAEQHGVEASGVLLLETGALPRTTSGKVQRGFCRAGFLDGSLRLVARDVRETEAHQPEAQARVPRTEGEILAWIVAALVRRLNKSESALDVRVPFASLGLDSREGVGLMGELGTWLDRRLSATLLWDHPTPQALARGLAQPPVEINGEPHHLNNRSNLLDSEPIAIIGIGCRFPGAYGPEAFWRLLREGRDAVGEVPPGRWDANTVSERHLRQGGFLEQVDGFDPSFFGIAPREAVRMDPQQRLLLEVAWEALEDAGVPVEKLAGLRTGVFIGISGHDYAYRLQAAVGLGDAYDSAGNSGSIAANRLSYFFGWQGPSLAVDTACSSSLVAVHLACRSLWAGESTTALAGGINLLLSADVTASLARAGFLSPDARCKAFDAGANGYVRGEGIGVILLKPLSAALADGDSIYAVIRGTAVNSDGKTNGLTAPSRQAQEAVLREAYQKAGVDPHQVQYVEAHGTGTLLGDPIEALALGAVLGRNRQRPCALGSVKTNIGHLETAAGIAGLIKTVLALAHRQLPPSLHFQQPNAHIPFAELGLRVQQTLEPWPEGERALAGVSSFGFGGTNAHVVLEAAVPSLARRAGVEEPSLEAQARALPHQPDAQAREQPLPPYLLPLSARSLEELKAVAATFRDFLADSPDDERYLSDLCYTAAVRRSHHDYRLTAMARSHQEMLDILEAFLADQPFPGLQFGPAWLNRPARLAFVFAGQGPQWSGMGRQLFEREPVFRAAVEKCDELMRPYAGWSLLEELGRDEANSRLEQTEFAQPALFALQVGLAALWRSWGVVPDAVVGHSLGEVSAAHVAGILDLPDAVHLIVLRGRLLQRAAGQGRMAAVALTAAEAADLIRPYGDRVVVAAVNGPESVVLSGETNALNEVLEGLAKRGRAGKLLPGQVAFHSPQLDSLVPELVKELHWLKPRASQVPFYSTVTGTRVNREELVAAYWGRNVREPVLFEAAVHRLLDADHYLFVELGPHPVLAAPLSRCLEQREWEGVVLPSLRRGQDELSIMRGALASLHIHGRPIDWKGLYPAGQCLRLPTYPWRRQRFWLDSVSAAAEVDRFEVLYELHWRSRPLLPRQQSGDRGPQTWLVFADADEMGQSLAQTLLAGGHRCLRIVPGTMYQRQQDDLWSLRPGSRDDLRRLLDEILTADQVPLRGIVHLWNAGEIAGDLDQGALERAQALGCETVLALVQELGRRNWPLAPRLWLVTRGSQAVAGEPTLSGLAGAPLWGFGRTLAQEEPAFWGGLVDLDPAASAADSARQLAEAISESDGQDQVAFRQGQRYVARLLRKSLENEPRMPLTFRADAAYLITGGLGGLGLEVARWMVQQGVRRLILLNRSTWPPRSTWRDLPADSREGRQVAAVRELESLGASVHLGAVDVADEGQLSAFLETYRRECWPPVRGVVHAAGVIQDQSLAQLEPGHLSSVLRPKVLGGWLLHRLFQDAEVDFFVLFSSAAALLGSPGQAHYAAANAFLDALAHHRRGQEWQALTINWGPWAKVGMAASPERAARLAARGLESLSPERALAVLGQLLSRRSVQVAVLSVNWERWRQTHAGVRVPPLFAELSEARPEQPQGRLTADTFRLAPPEQRRQLLEENLRRQLAGVLRCDEARLDVHRPLVLYGLDSLLALELKNRIESRLGLALPVSILLQGPSLDQLCTRMLEQAAAAEAPQLAQPIRTPEEDEFPLSHGQKALWFLYRLAPESGAYNLAFAVGIRSELDIPALWSAVQSLVDRHPALRTTYGERDGQPVQRVHARMAVPVDERDATTLSLDELREALAREMYQPFDLEWGPVFRVVLYRRGPTDHVLLLAVHHLANDFWSLQLVLEELGLLYPAVRDGVTADLPPLRASYAAFVRWQANLLAGPRGQELETYWKQQLAGELPVLNLPADRPRPPVQGYTGVTAPFDIDETLTQRLRELARAEGTTLFTVLLAAFQVLLHRHSGQDQVIVGAPVSSRSRADFERVIGYFINAVPLRGDLAGKPTFRAFLGQMRQKVLGALEHHDYPSPLLIERLQLPRAADHAPLYQALFILDKPHRLDVQDVSAFVQNRGGARLQLGGLELESVGLEQRTSLVDITLMAVEGEKAVSATLCGNSDLFETATLKRLAGRFRSLLEGIVTAPDCPLWRLPLLAEGERHLLLGQWNQTEAPLPAAQAFQELFEGQVARSPDALAARCGGEQLTYAELNHRANHLAHQLQDRGVGPEVVVPLLAERSLDFLTAILALFKAGAAYLPLDPHHPPARLAQLLGRAHCSLVMASRAFGPALEATLPLLNGSGQPEVLVLEDLFSRDPQGSAGLRAPLRVAAKQHSVKARNLAYVIYTSGSTGLPKGAMLEQGGMLNHLQAKITELGLTSSDVVAQTASQCFDISVWQFLAPLAVGGRVEILLAEEVHDPARLLQCLETAGVTVLEVVPSLAQSLLDEVLRDGVDQYPLASLRWLVLTGETFPPELARRWLQLYPQVPLLNAYGPTECSDDVTHHVQRQPPDAAGLVPIGRPILNTRLYILDRELNPTPIGVPGELYVGGKGVGRGYLHEPTRTAAVFLPDPFSPEAGARLYRTGDLARYRSDGTIEFLGRLDHQVKVRGFRIEMGEIEAALGQHPGIREVVVVARETGAGDQRLAAYLTAHEPAPTPRALREHLLARLPEYMVPSTFQMLPALPRNANGKIDRNALPAPLEPTAIVGDWVEPRTELEKKIAAVWQEALGVPCVGANDNFFDLGGHSLLLVRVHARLRQAGYADLPLIALFQFPTVRALARHLDSAPERAEELRQSQDRGQARREAIRRRGSAGRTPRAPEPINREDNAPPREQMV